jgi:hypothetical protein
MQNVYRNLVGNLKGTLLERPRNRWHGDIKVDLKGI